MSSVPALEASLRAAFPGALELVVEDISGGCGASFKTHIVAPEFDGVALLQRQRLVHAAIGDAMKGIHALEIKAWTPAQAAAAKSKAEAAAAAAAVAASSTA